MTDSQGARASNKRELAWSRVLYKILVNEWRLAVRNKQDLFNALMFFVLVIVLFPLGVDPGVAFLSKSAGGLVWVAFMLALMLTIGQMFKQDFDDGTIEQWVLCRYPLFSIVLAKVFALWLITTLPLIVISPVLAVMLHMSTDQLPMLIATLLIGTPSLALFVSIGAALTAGTRGGGLLLMLLVLPLATPVLIFATGILSASADGMQVSGLFALLAALLALAVISCPFAAAAALKMSVDN